MEALRRYSHRFFADLLETDPDVITWTTHVPWVDVALDGRPDVFIPHFLVRRLTMSEVIRITRAPLIGQRALDAFDTVANLYAEQGLRLSVITERDVKSDPRLPAARKVLWHRSWEPTVEMCGVVAALVSRPPATLGDLHRLIGDDETTWPYVVALVAHGWVEIDLSRGSVEPETPVLACRIGALV